MPLIRALIAVLLITFCGASTVMAGGDNDPTAKAMKMDSFKIGAADDALTLSRDDAEAMVDALRRSLANEEHRTGLRAPADLLSDLPQTVGSLEYREGFRTIGAGLWRLVDTGDGLEWSHRMTPPPRAVGFLFVVPLEKIETGWVGQPLRIVRIQPRALRG